MHKPTGNARSACMALVFALAAFSYAVATGNRGVADAAPVAAGRAVSTNLNFANPFVDPTLKTTLDRDLGDAIAGSAVVRHINALGGVRPYLFTSTDLASITPDKSLLLDTGGFFHTPLVGTGIFGPLNAGLPTSHLVFHVKVIDSNGAVTSNANTTYRLTVFNNGNGVLNPPPPAQAQFRFAMTQLSDGQLFRDYVDNLDVVNGNTWDVKTGFHRTFSFLQGSVKFAGSTTSSVLDDAGLHLTQDGLVTGVPLVSGVIQFTARCQAINTVGVLEFAKSRNGISVDQAITINVGKNVQLSNTAVCTALSVGGSTTNGGRDKLSLTAVVNTMGQPPTGNVTLHVNDYAVTGVIGLRGKITLLSSSTQAPSSSSTQPLSNVSTRGQPQGVRLSGSINAKGQLRMTVSNESFGSLGQIFGRSIGSTGSPTVNTPLPLLPAMVDISVADSTLTPPTTFVEGSQALAIIGKVGSGNSAGKFNSGYKVGSVPRVNATVPANATLSGAFILTSVAGKDDGSHNTTSTGDSWRVGFIAVPPNGPIFTGSPNLSQPFAQFIQANAGFAQLSIGAFTDIKQQTTAARGAIKNTNKIPSSTQGLTKLAMTERGKGSYTTGVIPQTNGTNGSNISPATNASAPTKFNFATSIVLFDGSTGLVFYEGDGAQTIFNPRGRAWTSTPPH